MTQTQPDIHVAKPKYSLNAEQEVALAEMLKWLNDLAPYDPFFVLKGYAGTGKTYTCQALVERVRGRIVFTAPTNKATKVLRETLTRPDYKPECRTIYSLLGLRLEASGEVRELATPDEPIDLTQFRLVVVDEGSMLNSKVMGHIREAAENFHLKFLFMGDAAQLPPVKEKTSPIWAIPRQAVLEKVMRHDNQILTLATRLRKVVDHPSPRITLVDDFDDKGGVVVETQAVFQQSIIKEAGTGLFEAGESKVISWRNVEVDRYNRLIRQVIFPATLEPWVVGDRVIFTAPAKDMNDEPMAVTDDEGTIMRVKEGWHPVFTEFKVYFLSITLDDSKLAHAIVLHDEHRGVFERKKEQMAADARATGGRGWKLFWEFLENFHQLRYAYAITAHRSQGSTYETVFVDYHDILRNRDRQEAFRCLYVACTRPKRWLILS